MFVISQRSQVTSKYLTITNPTILKYLTVFVSAVDITRGNVMSDTHTICKYLSDAKVMEKTMIGPKEWRVSCHYCDWDEDEKGVECSNCFSYGTVDCNLDCTGCHNYLDNPNENL